MLVLITAGVLAVSSASAGQRMEASWYDPVTGNAMANGVHYPAKGEQPLIAAHKTLPFGTCLSLTNEDNGKQAIVKVTDRGPFIPGRTLDLSVSAAKKLGFIEEGTATLLVEHIGTAKSGAC